MLALASLFLTRLAAAQSRIWHDDERTTITSFNDIAAIAYDGRRVFAASSNGLEIYDEIARTWQQPSTAENGYPVFARPLSALYDRSQGGLWLETTAGMFFWSDLSRRWDRRPFERPDTTMIRMSTRGTRDDVAWRVLSASLGLDPYGHRWPVTASTPGERNGTYWVGTAGGNIIFADARNLSSEWLSFGMLSRGAGAIAVAGNGTLWFGGDGLGPRDGITRASADLQQWQWYEAYSARAPRGDVTQLLLAGDTVWAAASDGVYVLPPNARNWQRIGEREGLLSDRVRALALTSAGAWAGTTHGIALLDRSTLRAVWTGLPAMRVYSIAARNDTVWVASDAGLSIATRDSAGGAIAQVSARPVIAVANAAGELYVLAGDGLYHWDGGLGARIADAVFANIGRPYALRGDARALYVLGENGVARLEGKQWSYLTAPGDLPAAPVRDVARAGQDTWIATPGGATRVRWP